MAEAALNGFRVTCPQCGAFVMKFAGKELAVELNCSRCHSVVTITKTPETTSVFASKTVVKPAK
jgi:ribosomal protein S27AE